MTITYKADTTGGAPAYGSTAGSLITLLDYLLVTTLGWTKPYTGTNLAAYKQPGGTNGFYLYVDDSNAGYAQLTGYETMSSISSGTGPFPTATQRAAMSYPGPFMQHWDSSGSSAKWRFWSNGSIFYLFIQVSPGSNYWVPMCFGDFVSYAATDIYNTVLAANNYSGGTSTSYCALFQLQNSYNSGGSPSQFPAFTPRSYTQIGTSVVMCFVSDYLKNSGSNMGVGGQPYPTTIDGALYVAPVWIVEASVGIRGLMPGLWNPCHAQPLALDDTYSGGAGAASGRSFQVVSPMAQSQGQAHMETSNTWGGI